MATKTNIKARLKAALSGYRIEAYIVPGPSDSRWLTTGHFAINLGNLIRQGCDTTVEDFPTFLRALDIKLHESPSTYNIAKLLPKLPEGIFTSTRVLVESPLGPSRMLKSSEGYVLWVQDRYLRLFSLDEISLRCDGYGQVLVDEDLTFMVMPMNWKLDELGLAGVKDCPKNLKAKEPEREPEK